MHWKRNLALALVLVPLCAVAVPADARAEQQVLETDNDLLRQGLALIEELQYERAIEALSAALLEPGNDRGELVAIYRSLGTLYVLLERRQEAELALTRLLCTDPGFAFDEFVSPRIRDELARVRSGWESEGRPCAPTDVAPTRSEVALDHDSPERAPAGEPVALEVSLVDPTSIVHRVLLSYRAAGETAWNETEAVAGAGGSLVATIPAEAVLAPAAVYFLRAVDEGGSTLTSLGTARGPLRIPVIELDGGSTVGQGPTSITRRWWFWTLIGVGVAAVATGIALGVVYGSPEPPDPPIEDAILTVRVCDPEHGFCP